MRDPKSLSKHLPETDQYQFEAITSGVKILLKDPIHVTDNVVTNFICQEALIRNKHFIFPSCTVMLHPEYQSEEDWDPREEVNKNYHGRKYQSHFEKMCKFYSDLGLKTTAIRHSNV